MSANANANEGDDNIEVVVLSDDISKSNTSIQGLSNANADDSLQIMDIIMKETPQLDKPELPPILDQSTSPIRQQIDASSPIAAVNGVQCSRLFVGSSSQNSQEESYKRKFTASDILQMTESEGEESILKEQPTRKKLHMEVPRSQSAVLTPIKPQSPIQMAGLTSLAITPARSRESNRGPTKSTMANFFSSSPVPVHAAAQHRSYASPTTKKPSNTFYLINTLSSPARVLSSSPVSTRVHDSPSKKITVDVPRPKNNNIPIVIENLSSDPIEDTIEPVAPLTKSKPSKKSLNKSKNDYTLKELNAVNKIVRRKEDLMAEMVIHISEHLYLNKFKQDYMMAKFINTEIKQESINEPIIYWTRNVKATYDTEKALFLPCEPKTIMETNLMVYLNAEEFFDGIVDEEFINQFESNTKAYELRNLYRRINSIIENFRMKLSFNKSPHVVFIIEGFEKLMTKLRSRENKKFRDLVTGVSDLPSSQEASQKRSKKAQEKLLYSLPSKEVEKLLKYIQFETGIPVFLVRGNQEAIEWLYLFTYTISKSLYDRLSRNKDFAHLNTVGSGVDAKLTFIRSLALFKRMTQEKATSLYPKAGSMKQLYKIYESGKLVGSPLPTTVDASMRRFFTSDDPDENISID